MKKDYSNQKSNELLEAHKKEWCNGCSNKICSFATKRVYFDSIPAGVSKVDILFIGEAPGESEDILGTPFIGRSGNLFRETIQDAIEHVEASEVTIGMTNLLACKPEEEDGRQRQPYGDEIDNCNERLTQLIAIVKPTITVAVGRLTKDEVQEMRRIGLFRSVPHPTFVLRAGGTKSNMYNKYFNVLVRIIKEAKKIKDRELRNE